MATSFVYSATVRPEQLQVEINNSVDFTATCTGINVANTTDVTIIFNTDLSGAEETALDALVTAHIPEPDLIDSTTLPWSDNLGKLAVHASSMPKKDGKVFYDVFTGCGDDVDNHIPGEGELVVFAFAPSIPTQTYCVKFDPLFGEVYIHGGYVKYSGADFGDYITCDIKAGATPLLTHTVPLDLMVYGDDDWVKYVGVGGSPVLGTHGLAGTPILIPRTHSMDGDWDYSPESGLAPNFAGTGGYHMSATETAVHRYVNKLPCIGDSGTYVEIESSEAGFLPPGYHIDVTAVNASGSSWTASFIINIYREQTINP